MRSRPSVFFFELCFAASKLPHFYAKAAQCTTACTSSAKRGSSVVGAPGAPSLGRPPTRYAPPENMLARSGARRGAPVTIFACVVAVTIFAFLRIARAGTSTSSGRMSQNAPEGSRIPVGAALWTSSRGRFRSAAFSLSMGCARDALDAASPAEGYNIAGALVYIGPRCHYCAGLWEEGAFWLLGSADSRPARPTQSEVEGASGAKLRKAVPPVRHLRRL